MIKSLSDRNSLFLLVRSHSQIQYYLKLADSHRPANQGAILERESPAHNVAEIHPLCIRGLRRRG